MYNQVIFYAKNTPVNATIALTVVLEGGHSYEDAISMGSTVLRSWGVLECNFDAKPVQVSYCDVWAE
jgi:hypothetical protein